MGAGLQGVVSLVVIPILLTLGSSGVRITMCAKHSRTKVDRRVGAVLARCLDHGRAFGTLPSHCLGPVGSRQLIQVTL
ncbi:Uncharacterised protein [Mycobacteroides abscessus subsp. abscessus]|nr:Uncharacterised protein [Mycobacteroides abscessus subsp. abscessus]